MSKFWVLVGSYMSTISILEFNEHPASLKYVSNSSAIASPSWLAKSPTNSSLVYVTDEVWWGGSINSVFVDASSGSVSLVDSVPIGGAGPTHLGLVDGGKGIASANYNSGTVTIARFLDNAGHFNKNNTQTVQFQGSGPEPNQDASHAHQVVPWRNELFVPDLGSDKVWRLVRENGLWVNKTSVAQPVGSGPRHSVVVDDFLYTLGENTNAVTKYLIGPISKESVFISQASIRPPDTDASINLDAAELLYSQRSRFLYASNRFDTHEGGDAITILQVHPSLKPIAWIRTGLVKIRSIAFLGDNEEYIVAAGQISGGVKIYKRVSPAQGYLKEVASLVDSRIIEPSSFVYFRR